MRAGKIVTLVFCVRKTTQLERVSFTVKIRARYVLIAQDAGICSGLTAIKASPYKRRQRSPLGKRSVEHLASEWRAAVHLHSSRWPLIRKRRLRVDNSRLVCQFWVFVLLTAESSKLSGGRYGKFKTE